jgi:anti-anti-sigma factor
VVNDSFGVKAVISNGRAIVFVQGEIDMSAGLEIRHALSTAQQGSPDVIVDVSGVTFMDSTGINALLRASRQVPPGGSLRVVGATSAVRRVFDITGVSELLLLELKQRLTWQQVTYHTSGWRQWMTDQTTNDGRPIAEIIEVGPHSDSASHDVHYALESEGETRLYDSLDEAIRAAELLASVTPPDVGEVTTMVPPV